MCPALTIAPAGSRPLPLSPPPESATKSEFSFAVTVNRVRFCLRSWEESAAPGTWKTNHSCDASFNVSRVIRVGCAYLCDGPISVWKENEKESAAWGCFGVAPVACRPLSPSCPVVWSEPSRTFGIWRSPFNPPLPRCGDSCARLANGGCSVASCKFRAYINPFPFRAHKIRFLGWPLDSCGGGAVSQGDFMVLCEP